MRNDEQIVSIVVEQSNENLIIQVTEEPMVVDDFLQEITNPVPVMTLNENSNVEIDHSNSECEDDPDFIPNTSSESDQEEENHLSASEGYYLRIGTYFLTRLNVLNCTNNFLWCMYLERSDHPEVNNISASLAAEDRVNAENESPVVNTVTESPQKKRRARKGRGDPRLWVIKKNQQLREQGELILSKVQDSLFKTQLNKYSLILYIAGLAYDGLTRTSKDDKLQYRYAIPRNARKLGPRCNCAQSKKESHVIRCAKISDEQRALIFANFWKMDWSGKKATIRTLVTTASPKDQKGRHRKSSDVSRRKQSPKYNLMLPDSSQVIRVCKKMFLATFDVKEWSVLSWISQDKKEKIPADANKRKVSSLERRKFVRDYLEMLPKMESHYCRKDTERLYLEPIWESKNHLYREYMVYCEEKKKKPLDRTTFSDECEDMKISIFSTRKDLCDVCVSYANQDSSVTEEDYNLHIKRKNEAQAEKTRDIKNMEKLFVFTMDVQAVLVCPIIRASAGYYKSKLTVHNFTLYDVRTQAGYCNLWDESEGDLSANVFATMITNFIETKVRFKPSDEIILWSDGCCYQNRNCVLTNALLNLAMKCGIVIVQKYLEKGHTQMEADSMHSTIERKLRRKQIYLPSAYMTYCETARINPGPYQVQYWHHDEFLHYAKLKFFSSIRPGRRAGDPQVVDLRALRYEPNGTLSYKILHSDEWTEMTLHRTRTVLKPKTVPPLFPSRLRITQKKYDDIQALKHVLPRDTHSY